MRFTYILIIFGVTALPAFADDSFNSIAGFSLGQSCTGSKFDNADSSVYNPSSVLDKIEVKRKEHESKVAGGHSLHVYCSIIDNKVNRISLTSDNSDDISSIKDSLRDKMGRSPDDTDETSTKPQQILGITIDGIKQESEEWHLSDTTTAVAYTRLKFPYGSNSISDVEWYGGIELFTDDNNLKEWNFLKNRGASSSVEKEKRRKEDEKNKIRNLLD